MNDGTPITTLNFTKGNDGWDPFNTIVLSAANIKSDIGVKVFSLKNEVFIKDVKEKTSIKVYGMSGTLFKSFDIKSDQSFSLPTGIWLVNLQNSKGVKSLKIRTN